MQQIEIGDIDWLIRLDCRLKRPCHACRFALSRDFDILSRYAMAQCRKSIGLDVDTFA